MRTALPVLFLLLTLPLHAADDIYDTPNGHDCFVMLLKKSGWGIGGPYEHAAFIVDNHDGTYGCIEWPSIHMYNAEQFRGTIPANAVAIAHTHPVHYLYPSEHDNDEATRLNIPIYTITIRGVYKSVPGTPRALMIANRQSWVDEKMPRLTAGLRTNGLAGNVDGHGVSNK